jgi:hypothetical protein
MNDHHLIVDLSQHFDALKNYADISERLSVEQNSRLVDWAKTAHLMAYRQISKRYDHWNEADRAHDVYVPPGATDFVEKAVIPDTRAITDTVITYVMGAIMGRNPTFQLEGLDRDSRKAARILERELHQNMRRTAAEASGAQLILDAARYGYAPTKISWNNELRQNRIVNANPRRSFFDPRVQWGDWDRGQFMIFSDSVSYHELYASGRYPYLYTHPETRDDKGIVSGWEGHRFHQEEGRGLNIDNASPHERSGNYFSIGNNRWVDEIWVRFNGYELGLNGVKEVWMVYTVLDESQVISCRLNPHGSQWHFTVGGLHHDSHKTYSQSLYDILLPLHDIATWLMRSRYDNVRAAMQNLIIADPTQIQISDLIERNEYGVVRTMPGASPRDGIFIAQVPDVTSGHWNDISGLAEMKQRVSAASDAMQGVPTAGVRSATEVSSMAQLGSQRLGLISRVMSATTFRPLVRMMVSNIQDSMSGGSIRLDSDRIDPDLNGMIDGGYLDYDAEAIQGNVSYMVVDGTLPLEPTSEPRMWMDILRLLTETGMIAEYRADKITDEIIHAMGVADLDLYKIPKPEQGDLSPSQQLNIMEKLRGASVRPNEDVQKEVEKGNLISLAQATRAA